MRGKNFKVNYYDRDRRCLALAMALVMLCSLLPASVFALAEGSGDYLCGHVHDESCGYAEGSEGTPCDHIHDENYGCAEAFPCTDVHTHNESCGYTAPTSEIPCDQGCTDTDGDGVINHIAGCAYTPATEGTPCTYTHIHDENCGYAEGSACTHDCSDGSCSYVAPVEGAPCSHVCNITSFYLDDNRTVWTADEPIDGYEAPFGATYEEICAALPRSVPGALACADGPVNVPVRWSCSGYSADAEVNIFSARLTNEHCAYTAADDPDTADIDESALPYMAITFAAPAEAPAPVCLCDPAPAEGEAHTNPDCPFYVQPMGTLCYISADGTKLYAEADEEAEIVATLAKNTPVTVLSKTEEWINVSCTVEEAELTGYVSAALTADAQIDEIAELIPNNSISAACADESGAVTAVAVTGALPNNAYLTVNAVAVAAAAELVGAESEAQILFAYDIKIMLPSETEGGEPTEYQPIAPVTVTVTPPAPIEAPVTVTHVSEDAATGETTASTVSTNATTDAGAVEFTADGFSIYIRTTSPAIQTPTPIMYWNGTNFYIDAGHTADNIVTDSAGVPYTALPDLLAAIDAATTIYMQAGYTVSGTESIGNATYAVTLMRSADADGDGTTTDPYTGSLITVASTGSLTLADITLDGGAVWDGALDLSTIGSSRTNSGGLKATASAVSVTGGTLTMNSGAVIQNNDAQTTSVFGGGLNLNGGSATLNTGAYITDNRADGGGGVNLDNAATFTLAGGTINSNCTLDHGENVALPLGGSCGGGIRVVGSSTAHINGGAVSGNRSAVTLPTHTDGGGLWLHEATVYISGGSISGNTSTGSGGGLQTSGATINNTNVYMSGGTISNNKALKEGGGGLDIYIGSLYLSGGTITGNHSATSDGYGTALGGGGIRVGAKNGKAVITGGRVIGNTAGSGNASSGVTVSNNLVTTALECAISGGTIDKLDVFSNLGVTISGGSIQQCWENSNTVTALGSTYLNIITLYGVNTATAVSAITCTETYGLLNVQTDDDGKLYLWLPADAVTLTATAGTESYYTTSGSGCVSNTDGTAADTFYNASSLLSVTGACEYGQTLTALFSAAETDTNTPTKAYQWQLSTDGGTTWSDISDATDADYAIPIGDIGKQLRVKATVSGSSISVCNDTFYSPGVTVAAPQISITVPTNIVVTVDGAGNCTVTGGSFTNNSSVPIYLTDVTYTWTAQNGGAPDADDLFSGWSTAKPYATLTLAADNAYEFRYTDALAIVWSGISANNSIAAGAAFTPDWDFSLNGSCIALAMAIDDSVPVATVTYTVGYIPPS